jgi:hypothetical protein
MSIPSPMMERLLLAASQLKAAGNSWETVSDRLDRSLATLSRWLVRYRAEWEAFYDIAERDQSREGGAESTATLRKQLREEDAKGKREAAKALLLAADRARRAALAESRLRTNRKKTKSVTDVHLEELRSAAAAATAAADADD